MLTSILAKILTSGPLLLLTLITEDECKVYLNDQGSGSGHTLPRGRPYPSQHRPAIRWSP